jgi:hypothetical protein
MDVHPECHRADHDPREEIDRIRRAVTLHEDVSHDDPHPRKGHNDDGKGYGVLEPGAQVFSETPASRLPVVDAADLGVASDLVSDPVSMSPEPTSSRAREGRSRLRPPTGNSRAYSEPPPRPLPPPAVRLRRIHHPRRKCVKRTQGSPGARGEQAPKPARPYSASRLGGGHGDLAPLRTTAVAALQ